MAEIFCIDTSSLIRAWHEAYSMDVVPSFWDRLEIAMKAGQVIFPDDVLREAGKRDPALKDWLRDQDDAIVSLDEVQDRLAEIMERFPRIAMNRKGASSADGLVIAVAVARDAIVITEETQTDSLKRLKIPRVCSDLGIECVNLLQFMRRAKWQI